MRTVSGGLPVSTLTAANSADEILTGILYEKRFSLLEVYTADEAFVTGTFAGLVHVTEVDGRVLHERQRGPMVGRLQQLYAALLERDVTAR